LYLGGAGRICREAVLDLVAFSDFECITIADLDQKAGAGLAASIDDKRIDFLPVDVRQKEAAVAENVPADLHPAVFPETIDSIKGEIPDRVEVAAIGPAGRKKAVFANTFPPNKVIVEKSGIAGKLLPVLPEWMVMRNLRKTTAGSIYPASGNSELVAAYMLEQSYGMMRKAQFVARFHCVLDTFVAPDVKALGIKTLIIESDNDPLVEEKLRIMLKSAYPSAAVKTFKEAGHFPYLNRADEYTRILGEFFDAN